MVILLNIIQLIRVKILGVFKENKLIYRLIKSS